MQDEVVVEAAGDAELRMGCTQGMPQQNRLPEVKGGPVDADDLTRWNERPIDRCVVTGVNRLVIEHTGAAFAGGVVIRVLRQIDDRGEGKEMISRSQTGTDAPD